MPFPGTGKVVKCWLDEVDWNLKKPSPLWKVEKCYGLYKTKLIIYEKRFGLGPSSFNKKTANNDTLRKDPEMLRNSVNK